MSDHRTAALGTVLSATSASSWLVTANAYVQLIAGIVAILSGLAAIWYYLGNKGKP